MTAEPVLTDAMEAAMRECWSYEGHDYGYRFRQATMRKCEAAGFARRLDDRKRCAWALTDYGKARLQGMNR